MADDGVIPPHVRALSPSQHLQFTADEGTPNSEDLLMDEDDSYECHDHDICDQQILEFEGNELGNDKHQRFETEGNDHENLGHQLLEIQCSDHENCTQKLLEMENEDHEDGNELVLEFKGNNHANCSICVLESEDTEQVHGDNQTHIISVDDQSTMFQDKYYPPPVRGMEFESYDDAYNYYNSYAKKLGFAIRVKSSWTKRKSNEKRGAVLCCNCEGFKIAKESTSRRKETRTGCLAMIRLRLAESNIWRVDEVNLDHNHSFDPERALNSKSHKKTEAEAKRNSKPLLDVEVRTIKLYCTSARDLVGCTSGTDIQSKRLKLQEGDIQAIHDYFCQVQLGNPNFMYLMDLNDEGQLKNVFWIDSRSRAAYSYFGDVVAIDTTYLSNKYDIPLVVFVGINHHVKSFLFGCSLLVDETVETYVWVLRAWLTCMLGRPPQTVITDQGKAIQIAISEVFPRAHHRLALPLVLQSILQNLGPVKESEGFQLIFDRTVYGSLRVDEFENSWGCMIQRFRIEDLEWLQNLYEDRERWAPVYLKDTFLAGLFMSPADPVIPFFNDCVHERTSVREFFSIYEAAVQKIYQIEAAADYESSSESSSSMGHPYQLQLSKLYTQEILCKFLAEVEMMSSCVNISQVHASGPVTTYMIKEREIGPSGEFNNLEVMYDKATSEVRCICGCFYVNGYLCRHALCVLKCNGVEEIPSHYILPRWRKDCKRSYALDTGSNVVDVTNPMQWYEHLYKRAIQLVEQGMLSQDHYTVAWQAFKEALNKVRLAKGEKHL